MQFKLAIPLALLLASNTACYSWRAESLSPVQHTGTTRASTYRVTHATGSPFTLYDGRVQADSLIGMRRQTLNPMGFPILSDSANRRAVPLAGLEHLETLRFSAGKTTALGLGVGLSAIAFSIAMAGFSVYGS